MDKTESRVVALGGQGRGEEQQGRGDPSLGLDQLLEGAS